jgi:flagellar basal-body rod protein FlgC
MDFLSALNVSASGLSAERTRLNIATSNLANAESTRSAEGGPYRRRDPVFETIAMDPSPGHLNDGVRSVHVAGIVTDESAGKRVYSPGHPDADQDGFVTLPNVDPVHEVVNLMSASRGYEANATAIDTLKAMAQRALDIAK